MIRIAASSLGRARASATAGPRAAAAAIEAQHDVLLSQRRGRGYNSTATRPAPTPTIHVATSIDRRRRLPGSFVPNSAASFARVRLEVAGSNRLLSSSGSSGDGASSFSVLPPRAEEEAVGDATETSLSQLLPPADGESTNMTGREMPSSSLLSTIAAEDTVNRGQRSRRRATKSTTRRGNRRPPHFLSPVNRSEGQLTQPPIAILHNEYKHRWAFEGRKDLANFDFDKCYSFNKIELDGKTLYHATFTCPETGCTFESGTPAGSQDFPNLQESANDFITFTGRSGDSSTAQSRNFYASKGFAKNAAAARAIDCLSLREYRLQKGEDAPMEEGTDAFRMCAEEPFVPQASLSTSSMISHPLGSSGDKTEVFFMSPKSRKFTTPVEFIQTSISQFHNDLFYSIVAGNIGSRGSIVERFSEVLKEEVPNSYEDPIEGLTSSTWLTARYTDPVSGVVFRSGTLPDYETRVINDEVYYKGKRECLQAAAARAIDCLSLRGFRKRNGDEADPASDEVFRLCEEEPYGDFEDVPLDQRNYSLNILTSLQDQRNKKPLDKNDPGYYFLSPHVMPSTPSKSFLHNMMRKFHPDLLEKVRPGFQSELIETDETGKEWWTAKYNDPLSGQTFDAGTLLHIPVSAEDGAARSTRIIDENVCYEEPAFAEIAAAARAIDCLALREFQKQRGEDAIPVEGDVVRLCSEEPFTDFDYDSYEDRNPVDDCTTKDSDYFMSAKGRFASKRHYTSPKEFVIRNYASYGRKNTSPELSAFLGSVNVSLSSLTKGDGDGGDYWWTSVFKCPLSGEEFSSGTLRDGADSSEMRVIDSEVCYESQKLAEQAACARAIDVLSLREFVKRRGEGLDVSEDCIMRLCEEEPYLSALDRPVPTEKSEGIHNKQPAAVSRHIVLPPSLNVSKNLSMNESSSKDACPSVGVDSSASVSALENAINDDAAEEFDDAGDDDDDYVVHTIPGTFAISSSDTTSSNAAVGLTTMERVLEAWIETPSATGSSLVPAVPIANTSSSGSELTPPRSKSSTMVSISNALAWFNRLEHGVGVSDGSSTADKNSKFEQKHTIGTLLQLPVSVNACNTLLRALADANSRLSFAEQKQMSSDTGFYLDLPSTTSIPTEQADEGGFLESIARQLLERMHDTQTVDGRSARAPSVETYNAYIGCLCRENPAETAVAAETILLKMLGDEHQEIPKPNIDTFNLVIEHWASVPGHESRTKIKEIYNELLQEGDRAEAAIYAEERVPGFLRPNCKTFLSAMSGLTQLPPEPQNERLFSEDEARYWLEQMETLAEKYGDDSLLPDAEAYNAPLRWSGDPNFSHARIHWDDYSSIYKDGFQDNETPDVLGQEDAEATERWVLQMEELGRDNERFSPTIESYESVIQAWSKTGTYPGLLRAEQWAQRAIEAASLGGGNGRVQPRLQTFHPIVASWAHCGYPERVQQWNDTLHELIISNEAMAGVTLDGRMHEALIVAWRRRQELSSSSTLASADSPSLQQERFATSIEAANACTECLEQLCARAKSQVGDRNGLRIAFDASTAERVIDAWSDVALGAIASTAEGLETGEDSGSMTPALALTEMVRAVESVNEVIDLYRSIPMDGLDEKTSEKYLYHMNHLMSRTPQLYARAIQHIYDADQIKASFEDTSNNHVLFESLLPSVEKMLRRCHFYNVALIPLGPSHRKERREFRAENELLTYRDSFSYGSRSRISESNEEDGNGCNMAHGHPLREIYSAVLDNCASMAGAVNSGDAFRLAMMIQKQLAIPNRMNDDEEKDADLHERAISVIDTLVEDDSEKLTLQKKLTAPEGRGGSIDDEEDNFDGIPTSSTTSFVGTSSSNQVNEEKKTKKRVIVKRRFPVSRRTTRGVKRRR